MMSTNLHYGPLEQLIGTWKGDKGLDVAPEPNGSEKNAYYETITYDAIGEAMNAGTQVLAVLRYHQVVQRQSNHEVFHDEVGYWMWDAKTQIIMHSFTIPRAVCVLAGGVYNGETTTEGCSLIEVSANHDDDQWHIIQSPFMNNHAKTISFSHRVIVGHGKMTYLETTMLKIYGKVFEHTDENELYLQ